MVVQDLLGSSCGGIRTFAAMMMESAYKYTGQHSRAGICKFIALGTFAEAHIFPLNPGRDCVPPIAVSNLRNFGSSSRDTRAKSR